MQKCEVVEEVRYLGVMVGETGRSIFKYEKKNWIKKANMAYGRLISQIKKCYDKVTVGKAIWKQIMLAALLFGKAVVTHSKTDIGKIQAVEYKVYRYLIGVATSLRSEIGASQIVTRLMETMLLFAKDT